MSTRAMLDAQKMINDHDWTFTDIEQSFFSGWSGEELRMIGRSDIVQMMGV